MMRGVKAWHRFWMGSLVASGAGACGIESTFPFPETEPTTEPPEVIEERGVVEGRVCSPSGFSWVGAADVRVRSTGQTARTDATGRYRLEGLEPGVVELDITKGSFVTSVTVEVVGGETVLAEPSCLSSDVSIAVVVGNYDNIEHLLTDLGLPYTLVEIADQVEWLRDPESLAGYDMVFFNCGMRDDWVMYPEAVKHLRDYVNGGGSIYVSDEAYLVVEAPFPDAIDFHGEDSDPLAVERGLAGSYVADVVDRQLQRVLGAKTADIRYDLRNWAIAERSPGGEPLLRALVDAVADDPADPPVPVQSVLATRARIGQGTVVYTSFHNETQTSPATGDMLRILEDIILSL